MTPRRSSLSRFRAAGEQWMGSPRAPLRPVSPVQLEDFAVLDNKNDDDTSDASLTLASESSEEDELLPDERTEVVDAPKETTKSSKSSTAGATTIFGSATTTPFSLVGGESSSTTATNNTASQSSLAFGNTTQAPAASTIGSTTKPTTVTTPDRQPPTYSTRHTPDHRKHLVEFYQHHNPDKLASVDETLAKYHGRETELFAKLHQRYAVTAPTSPSFPRGHGPVCFVEFASYGRVEIQLFADKAPLACENFAKLCTGEVERNGRRLTYRGCLVHRIVPNFCVQLGDYTKGDGTGGRSIFDPGLSGKTDLWGNFRDETPFLSHTQAGLVSMANNGPHRNASQFFVTLRALPQLNGKHVVFGKVIRGMDVMEQMAALPTNPQTQRPLAPPRVEDCGQVLPGGPDQRASAWETTQARVVGESPTKAFSFGAPAVGPTPFSTATKSLSFGTSAPAPAAGPTPFSTVNQTTTSSSWMTDQTSSTSGIFGGQQASTFSFGTKALNETSPLRDTPERQGDDEDGDSNESDYTPSDNSSDDDDDDDDDYDDDYDEDDSSSAESKREERPQMASLSVPTTMATSPAPALGSFGGSTSFGGSSFGQIAKGGSTTGFSTNPSPFAFGQPSTNQSTSTGFSPSSTTTESFANSFAGAKNPFSSFGGTSGTKESTPFSFASFGKGLSGAAPPAAQAFRDPGGRQDEDGSSESEYVPSDGSSDEDDDEADSSGAESEREERPQATSLPLPSTTTLSPKVPSAAPAATKVTTFGGSTSFGGSSFGQIANSSASSGFTQSASKVTGESFASSFAGAKNPFSSFGGGSSSGPKTATALSFPSSDKGPATKEADKPSDNSGTASAAPTNDTEKAQSKQPVDVDASLAKLRTCTDVPETPVQIVKELIAASDESATELEEASTPVADESSADQIHDANSKTIIPLFGDEQVSPLVNPAEAETRVAPTTDKEEPPLKGEPSVASDDTPDLEGEAVLDYASGEATAPAKPTFDVTIKKDMEPTRTPEATTDETKTKILPLAATSAKDDAVEEAPKAETLAVEAKPTGSPTETSPAAVLSPPRTPLFQFGNTSSLFQFGKSATQSTPKSSKKSSPLADSKWGSTADVVLPLSDGPPPGYNPFASPAFTFGTPPRTNTSTVAKSNEAYSPFSERAFSFGAKRLLGSKNSGATSPPKAVLSDKKPATKPASTPATTDQRSTLDPWSSVLAVAPTPSHTGLLTALPRRIQPATTTTAAPRWSTQLPKTTAAAFESPLLQAYM